MLHIVPPAESAKATEAPIASPSPTASGITDLDRPISVLLREGTSYSHEQAEHSEGASLLARGKLDKQEYIRFLFMAWHVYDELERALFEHRDSNVIFNIYNPRVFSRATALSFDICHLLGTVTWQTDPVYVDFYNNIPPAVTAYIARIAELGASKNESEVALLAAHAYVRYLGDLSGGQFIRRKIIKAYDLYDDGEGIWFYNFRTLDPKTGDRPAEMSEIKQIKEWFRNGLDEGVQDPKLKLELVKEANKAFEFNTGLFAALDPKVHVPSTPSAFTALQTKSFPLGTVVAFIIAACATHFVLVVGGYTGTPGTEKLAAVFEYLRGFVSSPAKLT